MDVSLQRSFAFTSSLLRQGKATFALFFVVCLFLSPLGCVMDVRAASEEIEIIVPIKITKNLLSKDATVRAEAVYDLRDAIRQQPKADAQNAIAVIAEKLKDPSGYVRRAAASSLRDLGLLASFAKESLIEIIRNYPDSDSSVFAIEALSSLGNLGAVFQQELEWYLPVTQIPPGRPAALNALKKCALEPLSPKTILYIERLLEENGNDALVEEAALGCLSRLAPDNAILLRHLEAYAKSDLVMRQLLVLDCIKANPNSFKKAELETLLSPLRESKYAEIAADAKNLSKGNACNQ